MPSLQIRDLPAHVYESLVIRARAERRSLSQQAVADLERLPELAARERRLATLRMLRDRLSEGASTDFLPRPEELVREDRER